MEGVGWGLGWEGGGGVVWVVGLGWGVGWWRVLVWDRGEGRGK